jgi:hypothetical protein
MNKSNSEQRPRLKVFEKFTPKGDYLRPNYAYLIRSSVRMPELYPLLGELLFASSVVKEGEKEDKVPPNIIGMFIEDTPDNLMLHLGNPARYQDNEDKRSITEKFGSELASKEPHRAAAWLDTYGRFHDVRGKLNDLIIGKNDKKWWRQSIPGAGSPMAIMRFFRLVQEKNGTAEVNLFLLNSLSNLYRNLDLSETAAFLKTMLNESIWSVTSEPDSNKVSKNLGLFFAVLQENVLDEHETGYLESFFDGIVRVDPYVLNKKYRVARVNIEVLPELLRSQMYEKFIYIPEWQFLKSNEESNKDWKKESNKDWKKEVYIRTKLVRECEDLEPANDKNKQDQS